MTISHSLPRFQVNTMKQWKTKVRTCEIVNFFDEYSPGWYEFSNFGQVCPEGTNSHPGANLLPPGKFSFKVQICLWGRLFHIAAMSSKMPDYVFKTFLWV